MDKIRVSAPGKIHLMGEHAVVYGKPALLSAINKRLIVTLDAGNSTRSKLSFDEGRVRILTIPKASDRYIRHAVDTVCGLLKKDIPPIDITVRSDIPSGFHLGSSAAVAVAIAGVLYYYLTNSWDLEKINILAYEVEKKMHGNPSGGDNTTVAYGGFVRYQKKSETEKVFEKMPFVFPKSLDHFCLIDTGRPKENTGTMVARVRDMYNGNPEKFNTIFDTNEKQVERMLDALKNNNEEMFIDAIRKGEGTLEDMGVVSGKVIPLIRDIEKAGGGAKILGGGGIKENVGFLLCYTHDMQHINKILRQYGYAVQNIGLGGEGVRIETA